jgi:hypothetical protein
MWNFVSFEVLKYIVCSPINPSCDELKMIEELILIKHDFNKSDRFENLHYLENLIQLFKRNMTVPNRKIGFLISKESLIEFKFKINKIYDELSKKISDVSNKPKNQGWKKIFENFEYDILVSQIFANTTSFYFLKKTCLTIYLMINIITKTGINFGETGSEKVGQSEISLGQQQYLNYFFDYLINLQEVIKNLQDPSSKFKEHLGKNINLKIAYEEFLYYLSFNINEKLAIKNYKENFCTSYGEGIKNIMKQLLIC